MYVRQLLERPGTWPLSTFGQPDDKKCHFAVELLYPDFISENQRAVDMEKYSLIFQRLIFITLLNVSKDSENGHLYALDTVKIEFSTGSSEALNRGL